MTQRTGANVMARGGKHEQGSMSRNVVHIDASYVSA